MTTSLAPKTLRDEIVTVNAEWRDESSPNPRQLRAAGRIPATLYGKGLESRSLHVDNHSFALAFKRGVRRYTLEGADGITAIAQQVQYHPVSFQLLNIEFWLNDDAVAQ
jgi:large subunit ribosomal protein L25